MRDALSGPGRYLDENGYLTIPFSYRTSTELSPLTRNHKVLYFIEAEIIGSDVGDTVGRLYVRDSTGTNVDRVGGRTSGCTTASRIGSAVLNPFFNGNRIFEPDGVPKLVPAARPAVREHRVGADHQSA